MIHRLGGCKPTDGRQHAEGVGCQEDDVPGMAGSTAGHVIGDEVNWIGRARVLGDGIVVQVDDSAVRVHDHVFENGPEALGGGVDLGLAFAREPNNLRVAPSLEIEHAVLRPSVFVVADEPACRVCRNSRLAGPRQTEEHRHVSVLPYVGRTVHRQNVLFRIEVIEDREHRLLHLARVARAANEHRSLREVHHDKGRGVGAVPLGVGLEFGSMQHGEAGIEIGQILGRRPDEHVAHEVRVPSVWRHEPDRHPHLRIGAGEEVLDEQRIEAAQVLHHVGIEGRPVLRAHGLIDLAPPHFGIAARFFHHELVVGRPAGVRGRICAEGPATGDLPFAPLNSPLVEGRGGQVPLNVLRSVEPGGQCVSWLCVDCHVF